ncbi:MAG: glycosyltransferase family 2 protein [Candidatus Hodarchaeota archaeon]
MKNYPLVSVVIPTYNRKCKLTRLIQSILRNDYPNERIQIIVVDDFSNDGTYIKIQKNFPHVTILRNPKERFVSASRNVGIKKSSGDYILFIDDDNVIGVKMIKKLVNYMKKNEDVAICAPLMLYYGDSIIWCAGVRRNMLTSKTDYLLNGINLKKVKLPEIIFSDDFPNCFMVRSDIIKTYDIFFDEKLFPIHYEESDFCYKIKKLGYMTVCYTNAIVWHDVKESKVASFEKELRTHFAARNRIIFHKKYSKGWQFLIFISTFNWLFTLFYLKVILTNTKYVLKKRIRISIIYLKGVFDGILQVSKKNL